MKKHPVQQENGCMVARYPPRVSSAWLFYAIAGYYLTFAFEGAVRYGFQAAGLGSLLYLRDLIPCMLVLGLAWQWIKGGSVPVIFLFGVLALAFHFLVGRYVLPTLFQSLFALKIFLPFISGVLVAYFYGDRLFRGRWVAWLLVLTLLGVGINYFVKMPWEGAVLETAFGSFTQSRDWTADGVRRLAGFSRASFDAASLLLILGIVQLSRFRFGFAWFLIYVSVFVGIALTTTKGALLGISAFAVLCILTRGGRRKRIAVALILGAGVLVAVVPLLSQYLSLQSRDLGSESFWFFSSFLERMNGMWPAAFKMLDGPLVYFFGRGIGGIGVAQAYGDWWSMNAADNVFVYFVVSFGAFGIFYYSAVISRLAFLDSADSSQALALSGLALSLICFGLTANLIEGAVLSAALGYLVAFSPVGSKAGRVP